MMWQWLVLGFVQGCDDGTPYEDIVGTNPTTVTNTGTSPGAACGNGVVERGELCDDGNTSSDDYCAADCLTAGQVTQLEGDVLGMWVSGQPQVFAVEEDGTAVPQEVNRGAPRLQHLGDACAIDTSGQVRLPGGGMASLPAGQVDCATHDANTCGVDGLGIVTCENGTVPDGEYVDVAVGVQNACGVAVDGSLECWGPTADEILVTSTGYERATGGTDPEFCAVLRGELWCSSGTGVVLPGANMVSAHVGRTVVCGLRDTRELECLIDFADTISIPGVLHASLYDRRVCVVTDLGQVLCRTFPLPAR